MIDIVYDGYKYVEIIYEKMNIKYIYGMGCMFVVCVIVELVKGKSVVEVV